MSMVRSPVSTKQNRRLIISQPNDATALSVAADIDLFDIFTRHSDSTDGSLALSDLAVLSGATVEFLREL